MIDLSFIPKKYVERVSKIEVGFGLIDNCKYLLYFNDNWSWYDICCEIIEINLTGNFINHISELKLKMTIGIQGVIKSGNELYVEKLTYLKSM